MKKRKNIGFFGGSFDPIHNGHLNLAIQIKENRSLDEIIFCPANCSPFKGGSEPKATPTDRVEMVKCAIDSIPFFSISLAEIERPPPSYTIDTLKYLKTGNDNNFFLILSDESAQEIPSWKESAEILRLAPPIIGTRYGFEKLKLEEFPPFIRKSVESGICPINAMDISSTLIRNRLKNNLYCSHFLPGKVLDYIYQNHLYCASKN